MFRKNLTIGQVLGHLSGVVGVTIGVDLVLSVLLTHYVRLYPYRELSSSILSILLIAVGLRIVRESLPKPRRKGPWGGP